MKYGFVFPGNDPRVALACAQEAETAGWDGFFVWDAVWGMDPWATLAAAAVQTERIRLGTMITPVSRRRPWKLAGETATVDQLSGGRLILAVGLGALETGFAAFGEETDLRRRAELLDEGLAIVSGLWQGQPFRFEGKQYRVEESTFTPALPPVQSPRIPIWVVGAWPRPKSMRRVARWDGWLPNKIDESGQQAPITPEEIRAGRAFIEAQRPGSEPFDVIIEGETDGADPAAAAAVVAPWAEVGATWWLEARWSQPEPAAVLERIRQGPPLLIAPRSLPA
jgi:alkanesulfonate monooxygenase SsuD/methylene tetrahydromethanopterin reductase-like flavin-dependent oxidoreductase (luciferase family)